MAKSIARTVPQRRKREGRTNYRKRLALLKSRKPRLVVRKSNKHVVVQLVQYAPDGDVVIEALNSKLLEKKGWKHSTKSIPACYLTGLAFGSKALAKGVKEAVLDLGLHPPVKGSRIYAVLKGVVDAGLNVPCQENVFPAKDRLAGKHISETVAADWEKMRAELAAQKKKTAKGGEDS